MSISTPQPGYIRVTTGDVDLPVEVRDRRMRLIDRGLSGWSPSDGLHGRDVPLDPGTYIVSVRLPGGRTLAEPVELQAGDHRTINLKPGDEWLIPRVRYSTAAFPAAGQSPAEQVGQPSGWAFRFFQLEGLSEARPIPAPSFTAVPESVAGSVTFQIDEVPRRVIFAQVARPLEIPLNIALLASSELGSGCLLTVEEQAGTLYAGVLPSGELVKRAAQFLAAGEEEHAALLLSSEEAEELLYHKFADPMGAAIGGYLLLRLNELERTHRWTENLARVFKWLPDGAVIAGEKAAMLGDHLQALDYFLMAGQRGLPVFTDGFSILVSRLRQYGTNTHIRAQLTDQQAADVRALSARLEKWSSLVDFRALTLTFRAAVLTEPTESQHPVEVDKEFISWPSA